MNSDCCIKHDVSAVAACECVYVEHDAVTAPDTFRLGCQYKAAKMTKNILPSTSSTVISCFYSPGELVKHLLRVSTDGAPDECPGINRGAGTALRAALLA